MSQPRGPEPQPGYGSPRDAGAQALAEKAYRKAQRPWNVSGDVCFTAPQGNPAGRYIVLLDPSFRFTAERIAWLNTL